MIAHLRLARVSSDVKIGASLWRSQRRWMWRVVLAGSWPWGARLIAHLDVSNGRIDGTIVAWRRSARRRCLQRNRGTVEIVECERTFAKLEDDLSWQGRMEKLMVAQQEAAAARMKAIEEQMMVLPGNGDQCRKERRSKLRIRWREPVGRFERRKCCGTA